MKSVRVHGTVEVAGHGSAAPSRPGAETAKGPGLQGSPHPDAVSLRSRHKVGRPPPDPEAKMKSLKPETVKFSIILGFSQRTGKLKITLAQFFRRYWQTPYCNSHPRVFWLTHNLLGFVIPLLRQSQSSEKEVPGIGTGSPAYHTSCTNIARLCGVRTRKERQ